MTRGKGYMLGFVEVSVLKTQSYHLYYPVGFSSKGAGGSVFLCFSLKSKDLILSLLTNAFHSLLSKCNCVFNTKQEASRSWRFDD